MKKYKVLYTKMSKREDEKEFHIGMQGNSIWFDSLDECKKIMESETQLFLMQEKESEIIFLKYEILESQIMATRKSIYDGEVIEESIFSAKIVGLDVLV